MNEIWTQKGEKRGTDTGVRITTTNAHCNLIVYAPWLVEKLPLSATKTVTQPTVCNVIGER
jgi:hypothetical protein